MFQRVFLNLSQVYLAKNPQENPRRALFFPQVYIVAPDYVNGVKGHGSTAVSNICDVGIGIAPPGLKIHHHLFARFISLPFFWQKVFTSVVENKVWDFQRRNIYKFCTLGTLLTPRICAIRFDSNAELHRGRILTLKRDMPSGTEGEGGGLGHGLFVWSRGAAFLMF